MADLSSISKYITKGKESQAQSIASSAGHSIYSGGSSGGSSNVSSVQPYQGTDTAGFINYLNSLNVFTPGTNVSGLSSYVSGKSSANQPLDIAELKKFAGSPTLSLAPQPTPDNFLGYGAGALAGMTPIVPQGQETGQPETGETFLQKYGLDKLVPQQPERIDRQAIAEQAGLVAAQKEAQDLSARINMEQAKLQSNLLQLRGVASREGVTEPVYGGQAATLEREAAIRLMPLTAQYQAAVGNVEAAKEIVSNFIADENNYQSRLYQWQSNLFDTAMGLASKAEQNAIDDRRTQEDRAFTMMRDNNNSKEQWAKAAFDAGQSTLGGSIMKLDPQSATFAQDLGNYTSRISTGGGVTGGVSDTKTSTPLQLAQAEGNIQQITELTKGGSTAVGTSFLTRTPTGSGFWGTVGKGILNILKAPLTLGVGTVKDIYGNLSGEQQNFIAGVEQLRSTLSLDNLIQAKSRGATFGALSDSEMKILSSSASKLGTWAEVDGNGNIVGYNTTEANFRKELDKINYYAKMDYLLKGGNPESIGVILQPDGTYWTQNSDGTLSELK